MRSSAVFLGLALTLVACGDPTPPKPDTTASQTAAVTQKPAMSARPSATARPTATASAEADPALAAPADVAEPPKDAEKTKSGLTTKVLEKGTGTKHPAPEDRVLVNYTGWTKDGKMFDSSIVHKKPIAFGVKEVIPGWTEGLQLMVEKEKRRMSIPAALAYGDTPQQPGAPSGNLTFDVELLQILTPPETPKDVAAPPKDAKKTASGMYYKVITPGKGTDHPKETSKVVVNYSGWTKDGKMFDSSITTGEPARFPLNHVIKGWTEGVQLMVVGEKTRFWIPAELAYGDKPQRPGAPSGQLTFDIELMEIQ